MTQPYALFLADILEDAGKPADVAEKAAAELRRQHAELLRLQIDSDARDVHLSERMKDLFKVEAQRDALLEACRAYDDWADKTLCYDRVLRPIRAQIRAAIAKAEENT